VPVLKEEKRPGAGKKMFLEALLGENPGPGELSVKKKQWRSGPGEGISQKSSKNTGEQSS